VVFVFAGIVLAALSWYFLRGQHWVYSVVGAVVAMAESIATGFILGLKRAFALTTVQALVSLGMGRAIIGRIFGKMEIADSALKRLPLAQAEQSLAGAVRNLTGGDAAEGSWLRRKVQARLLGFVQEFTLARFRQENQKHGGIDLLKVRQELESSVDSAVVQRVRGGLFIWTIVVIVGLPAVVAAQTWLAIALLHSKG
jgi:hypothetical protein